VNFFIRLQFFICPVFFLVTCWLTCINHANPFGFSLFHDWLAKLIGDYPKTKTTTHYLFEWVVEVQKMI